MLTPRQHINPIPSTIYRLFQSVIESRRAIHAAFLQTVTKTPDPEIEKINISHKHFMDTLIETFEALGGRAWSLVNEVENDISDQAT